MKEVTTFLVERKGYCCQAVDKRLQELLHEIEHLQEENAVLRSRVDEAVARADALEARRELIEETLLQATAAAQEITKNAKAEAEELIRRAQESDERQFDALEEKEKEIRDLRNRVEYILRSQLALLERE